MLWKLWGQVLPVQSQGETFSLTPKGSWAGWWLNKIFIKWVSLKIAIEHSPTIYILTFPLPLSFTLSVLIFTRTKDMKLETLHSLLYSEFLVMLCKQTKWVPKHSSAEGSHQKGGERKGSSAFLSSLDPPWPTREHLLPKNHCAPTVHQVSRKHCSCSWRCSPSGGEEKYANE